MNNFSNDNSQNLTSDERLLAMLAHLSIFLGGIILPIILWATQKDKSKFVTFNSLQAIFYHIAYAVIVLLFILFVAFLVILSGIGLSAFTDSNNGNGELSSFMIIMIVLLYCGIFVLIFLGIGYAVYLAVKTYQGNIIKIPLIGNLVYKKVYGENK
ncbi:MAG: DUF4870 domain-containing protein [bacterium]